MNWTSLEGIENIEIAFGEKGSLAVSICLAIIMFGVALKMEMKSFFKVAESPKVILSGLLSQWLLLPALTLLLVLLIDPPRSIALGMLLVSVCPGGNVSNFYTDYAKGNTALSVTLTSFSTLLTAFLTPLIFLAMARILLKGDVSDLSISFWEMLKTLFWIILLPLALGMLLRHRAEHFAGKLAKWMRVLSFVLLAVIVVGAFMGNADTFVKYLGPILLIVVVHNALAFSSAWFFARAMGNSTKDSKSICIETGIQNSGLGLVIIFLFFDGNGGMACVAAFWGFWHLVSGGLLSTFFRRKSSKSELTKPNSPA